MILQFKAKIKDGLIRRPELKPSHVVKGGPYNDLTFKMALRRFYRGNPSAEPPKQFKADEPPEFVHTDTSGYLAIVTITYPGV